MRGSSMKTHPLPPGDANAPDKLVSLNDRLSPQMGMGCFCRREQTLVALHECHRISIQSGSHEGHTDEKNGLVAHQRTSQAIVVFGRLCNQDVYSQRNALEILR